MKKGRHRRFEEARNLKRSWDTDLVGIADDESETTSSVRCDECGAAEGASHASWCLAEDSDDASGGEIFDRSSADKSI